MLDFFYKYFVEQYTSVKYENNTGLAITSNQMVKRLIDHQNKIPDYLRFGIKGVTLIFLLKNLFFKKKIRFNFVLSILI